MENEYEVTFTTKVPHARSEYAALILAIADMLEKLQTCKPEELNSTVKQINWPGREHAMGDMT